MKVLEDSHSFLTVDEIKVLVGEELSNSEIYEHLRHITKSIRRSSGGKKALLMKPPTCRKCSYVFKDLSKPRKPSKCPRCRSEWIEPPAFKIAGV
ncbi:MAG: transcriptional regulator [Desulfurococcales archaeon]|nr:transcriptional regulator [Desulfurococcales archaeon]